MYKLRRKLLSQNFLRSRELVKKLIRGSSIGKNDLVLDIGAGKGIITGQLLHTAQHVIAVELDNNWYIYLRNKFCAVDNITLYHGDILNFSLPVLSYKVFASIPFAIEGKIIRKLINAENPPDDCYLVMMKELAYRLAAPYKENMFSIMHKPWFDFSIYYHFKRTDFTPIPSVKSVMLRFKKREMPLLPWKEKKQYQKYVKLGFGHGLRIFDNLKSRFGDQQTYKMLNKAGIRKNTKPGYISVEQWIKLYQEFRKQNALS